MSKTLSASEHEKAINASMRLTMLNNYPISHHCNRELYNFSKYNSRISKNEFRSVLFKTIELVKKSFKNGLSETKCPYMLVGWTNG